MTKTIKFGILLGSEVKIDDEGFIKVPVIIQESGLFLGAPPAELRITEPGVYGDATFNKQYVAELNKKADLPFYLSTAKIKVDRSEMVKWTEKLLVKEGIEPLKPIEGIEPLK